VGRKEKRGAEECEEMRAAKKVKEFYIYLETALTSGK